MIHIRFWEFVILLCSVISLRRSPRSFGDRYQVLHSLQCRSPIHAISRSLYVFLPSLVSSLLSSCSPIWALDKSSRFLSICRVAHWSLLCSPSSQIDIAILSHK
jgi:hypothetical protein